ncbi:clusterin-associated protein 1 homolog [Salvia splendens]|uniref:clusterin-associated protein 1 homolog n=1 Tax=Salvia splendens TaxID=180675 RepID=UPI0011048609|nr:clusterin-associated protein 1 homolog [Salvia splendens]
MGCFVSCFGLKTKKKKKKTRKPSSLEQDSRSYVPLDSDLKQNLHSDTSQLKEEKPLVLKLKKKVRFNLNVKAYEPIPDDDEVEGGEETGLRYEEDVIASSYPASYRYHNCRYSDSEEDGDIDLDEDEDDDDDDDDFSSIQSDDIGSDNDVKNQDQESVGDLLQQATESRSDAGRYVSSVLCPVENLSQWRAVKAKAAIVQPKLQKENIILSATDPHSDSKRRSDVAVDASLSNWLSSLEMNPLVKSSGSGQRLDL